MKNSNTHINQIDYIEFYVGNLFQSCHFYKNAMGFTPIGYKPAQYSAENTTSILMEQNGIRLILTAPLDPFSTVANHIHRHGDGVKDIAFLVNNVEKSFKTAVNSGAKVISPPSMAEDQHCIITKAIISTFGDTQHSLIERPMKLKHFLPYFQPYSNVETPKPFGLQSIDHLAICVEQETLLKWKNFYETAFHFHEFHQEEVHTGNSGMASFALKNSPEDHTFSFVLVAPIPGLKKSQVQEFIDSYGTAGVQHLALLSNDILHSVQMLRSNEIPFLPIPGTYYKELSKRVVNLQKDMNQIQALEILVDQDSEGDLYQAFSKTIQTRPTFFIEIIQRLGAKGFGSRNIKKLFEAVELEQMTYDTTN
jgi:4-hydroxyphenylpyruvate dioxygenase